MKRVMINALMLLVACGVLTFLSITRGTLPISASQLWALINGEAARNIQLIVL